MGKSLVSCFFLRHSVYIHIHICMYIYICIYIFCVCPLVLQCFDAVGWVAGRASGLSKQSGGVLVWLSVWSEVQTCIWPSWCHYHSLSLASVKSRLVLPFWYWHTRVVPEKGPLNGCLSVHWLISETYVQSLQNYLYLLLVVVARSVLITVQYGHVRKHGKWRCIRKCTQLHAFTNASANTLHASANVDCRL